MALGYFESTNDPADTSSYDRLAYRRKLLDALMAKGADTSPIQHWTQGLARILDSAGTYYQDAQLKGQEKAQSEAFKSEFGKIFGAGGEAGATSMAPSASTSAPASMSVSEAAPMTGDRGAFVTAMMPHALKVSQETGLDPRLVVAQSALETGWGEKAPGNNYFGIKSHGVPGGQSLATTEVINGQPVQTRDSFRTYENMASSAQGYADFLKSNPRYATLLKAQGVDAQIAALGASGYATDPQYAAKVASIIRKLPASDASAAINQAAPVQVASNAPGMGYSPQVNGPIEASALPPPDPTGSMSQIPGSNPVVAANGFSGTDLRTIPAAPNVAGVRPPVGNAADIAAPGAAPAQFQAPGANQPGSQDRTKMLLMMAMDPRFSPQQKQMAMQAATMLQGQSKVSTVDLGTSIGVMDARGNIVRTIPKSKDDRPIAIGPDQRLVDPRTGAEIAPSSGGKAPVVQRVKQPDGSEVAVQWDDKERTWVPLKAPQGGNPLAMPKLTEQQSKDVGFYNRGAKIVDRLEEQDKALTSVIGAVASQIPGGNFVKSDSYRQAEQTGRELLAVILRKDTGAAVTDKEVELYGAMYLPRPGDDAATIEQKRQGRRTAIDGIRMGLGSAEVIFKQKEALEALSAPKQVPEKKPAASEAPPGAKQGRDGNFYVPDPNRPGKYLKVEQ